MAPTKFGLFKSRSREQPEQPSTENLLQSNSSDYAMTPGSPVPSTSKAAPEDLTPEDISDLHIDSEDEENSEKRTPVRRLSQIKMDDTQVHYHPLKNRPSDDTTSTSTLQEDEQPHYDELTTFELDNDGASTSADCNSIQLDDTSIAPSEDISVYCGALKKPKKTRSRTWIQQQIRDLDMWQASNVEVMQNLLRRSGTVDEQIKWEAIATARGLCTLTDSCTCADCKRTKYLAGMTDGDGGLGAAPLFSAISVGCVLQ